MRSSAVGGNNNCRHVLSRYGTSRFNGNISSNASAVVVVVVVVGLVVIGFCWLTCASTRLQLLSAVNMLCFIVPAALLCAYDMIAMILFAVAS